MVISSDYIYNVILNLLGFLGILSGIMVILTRNPVHSVFFLVLVFSLVSGILFLLNMEFLGVVFIIVYVGAIAVLFLFIIMMLNIRLVELEQLYLRYLPVGALVLGLLYVQLKSLLVGKDDMVIFHMNTLFLWGRELNKNYTMYTLGEILYTYYSFEFLLAGVILLVAMVGTIMVTLNHQINVKRQEVFQQVSRDFSTVIGIE